MEEKKEPTFLPDRILELLAKKTSAALTESEEKELQKYISAHPDHEPEMTGFLSQLEKIYWLSVSRDIQKDKAWITIQNKIHKEPKRRRLYTRITGYAALLLILLTVGWFLLRPEKETKTIDVVESPMPQRHHKAILVLSNGEELTLDNPKKTALEEPAGITITNQPGEVLTYDLIDGDLKEPVMNHLIVPAGARYQVQLSDGTKVWINSVSELEYPVAFGPGERSVKLTGEAYFDVASDPDRPFVIETNGYSITALGTAFNVSTYTNDSFMETTLVEGAVEVVVRQGKRISLKPGQSMRIDHTSQEYKLQDVDTRFYTSWKEGVLHFNKVTLSELCVKLERWYDAEILFSNPEKGKLVYSGALENSRSIEYLLNLIEQTADVHFVMEESTIRVE